MEIEQIKKDTINDLQAIITELKKIQFAGKISYKFNTLDLQDEYYVENFLEKMKTEIDHKKYKYIYTFILPDTSHTEDIYNRYKKAKGGKKSEREFARLNSKSSCLYVGSSKGLTSRIKQHFGFGPKGTFAMQLCHWCEGLDLDISLNIYSFNQDISTQAFQAFEDGAWNALKPMLGRQGKR